MGHKWFPFLVTLAHLHQVPQAAGHQQHIPRRQALEVEALEGTIQLAAGDQAAAQPAPRGWSTEETVQNGGDETPRNLGKSQIEENFWIWSC